MMTSLSKPAGYGCYGWQLATTQGAPPRRSGHVISVKTRKIAVLRNTYELTDRLRIVGHPCSGTPPGPGGSADLLTPDKQGSNKAGPKLLRVEEVARRRLWDRPSKTAFKTVQASTPVGVPVPLPRNLQKGPVVPRRRWPANTSVLRDISRARGLVTGARASRHTCRPFPRDQTVKCLPVFWSAVNAGFRLSAGPPRRSSPSPPAIHDT
jgi:hypothetical protein